VECRVVGLEGDFEGVFVEEDVDRVHKGSELGLLGS